MIGPRGTPTDKSVGNLTGWLVFNQRGRRDQTGNKAKCLTHLGFSAMLERNLPLNCGVFLDHHGIELRHGTACEWKGYLKLPLVSCAVALFPDEHPRPDPLEVFDGGPSDISQEAQV